MDYKTNTQNILNWSQGILDHISSKNYTAQISGQDISSLSSPYKTGDQTLGETIDTLVSLCRIYKDEAVILDHIDYNQRQSIHNHLQNLQQWIIGNPIGNWNNIISYVNALTTFSTQSGLNPYSVRIDSNFRSKISKIKVSDSEIEALKKLKEDLVEVRDASRQLDDASKIISFVQNTKEIEDVTNYVNGTKETIDRMKGQVDTYLKIIGDQATTSHFGRIKEEYERKLFGKKYVLTMVEKPDDKAGRLQKFWSFIKNTLFSNIQKLFMDFIWPFNWGWLQVFVFSLFIFVASLYYVYHLSIILNVQNEYLKLLGTGSIRLALLSPAAFFLTFAVRNYSRTDKIREAYEFKSVTSATIEAHLKMMKDNEATVAIPDTARDILLQIYTEPSIGSDKKDDLEQESILRSLSVIEKIKSITKS